MRREGWRMGASFKLESMRSRWCNGHESGLPVYELHAAQLGASRRSEGGRAACLRRGAHWASENISVVSGEPARNVQQNIQCS